MKRVARVQLHGRGLLTSGYGATIDRDISPDVRTSSSQRLVALNPGLTKSKHKRWDVIQFDWGPRDDEQKKSGDRAALPKLATSPHSWFSLDKPDAKHVKHNRRGDERSVASMSTASEKSKIDNRSFCAHPKTSSQSWFTLDAQDGEEAKGGEG